MIRRGSEEGYSGSQLASSGQVGELIYVDMDDFLGTFWFCPLEKSARGGCIDAAGHCPIRTTPCPFLPAPLDLLVCPDYP